ncbi:phage tail X family protein [Pseudovibrio sp. FO-BEG1]|uniref:tail protein X n=1 Tax=Pseudovibrio sp. (strain FO-BEG1) TaxID=911045 RepID=UPI000238D3A4|nr:tail protein X [Pseudovibrio sp. FO-BEG1]AEV37568.1 phage tail X family protein [Pseudovibrio sp. FO-BEG1]
MAELIEVDMDRPLDLICSRYYGHTKGSVEAVLNKNEHLVGIARMVPRGTKISMPVLGQNGTAATLKLWD